MLIKEACRQCKLTKKAIEYYEAKGLVRPVVLENGYRDYSEKEILELKEISVLRQCGVGISEIKDILSSKNKSAALKKYKYVAEVRMQRLLAVQKCMDSLIQDYDIDREFEYLNSHCEDIYTIKERLVFAFPGNYGLFLSLHFGGFLNEPIDTKEKMTAYDAILKYLDNVDVYLSPELSDLLEEITTLQEIGDTEKVQRQANETIMEALSDTDNYLKENKEDIERYLEFKGSEEFKQSPAGQIQQCLLEFQKKSGYKEIFIENMKILSESYSKYFQQLEEANKKFIEKFPASKDIYEL